MLPGPLRHVFAVYCLPWLELEPYPLATWVRRRSFTAHSVSVWLHVLGSASKETMPVCASARSTDHVCLCQQSLLQRDDLQGSEYRLWAITDPHEELMIY